MKIDFTPWHVSDPESCNEVIDSMGRTIAQVEEWRNENRENVTLLAAAPEMLEALENIIAGIERYPVYMSRDLYAVPIPLVESAREIIAKAKGE